jgi:DNA primase
MAFPDAFVEEVRRTADIVRLISDHVSLRKMGTSWKGLCPFHQEKTPSFNVRAEPAAFHCFGCGEGGDVFKFVMLRERASFPEAVEIVARRFGIPVPENRYEAGPDRKQREQILALMEAAAEHFRRNLWTAPGRRALEYLEGRGFRRETLERIRAGAAADSWSDLLDALKRSFPVSLLQTAGLVLEKQGGNGHYDRFRNRAVFPILSESGKVVAFGARSLDGSEPKYLNSPETPVYQKGRTLYGLSWARDEARRAERLVLMEGYLDVARSLEGGVGEAVATCGTALTAGHARLLHRFADKVVLGFDQDDAGQKATEKSVEVLVAEGLDVRVVDLPEGHDPDSYVKESGGDAFRQRLDEARPYMEWLIRRASARHETATPAGKGAYLEELLPALVAIESAVERAAWVPAVVRGGGLDETATLAELRRALGSRRGDVAAPASRPVPGPRRNGPLPAERLLLTLLLSAPESAAALGELADGDLEGLRLGPALRAARSLSSRSLSVSLTSLTAEVEDPETQRMLSEIAVEGAPAEGITAEECVRELKRHASQRRQAEIQKELEQSPSGDDDAVLREKLAVARGTYREWNQSSSLTKRE